jgi:DNA-binding NarL/FixJ family response regulator
LFEFEFKSSIRGKMSKQKIRVLLVEDHAMVRKGIKLFLQEYEGISIIGEAANGLKAIELADQLRPDVILMDLSMPIMDGVQAIRRILSVHPDQRIVVLTGSAEEDDMMSALQAGAMGYLKKDARVEELIQSIRDAHTGVPTIDPRMAWKMLQRKNGVPVKKPTRGLLSDRELDVFRLFSLGMTDEEVANELVISTVTVRTHINRIMQKMGVESRVQAALYGLRLGLASIHETRGRLEEGA